MVGESNTSLSLRDITGIRPMYILPNAPLVEDVLIPNFAASASVDSMMGFFSSSALADLAPGLATFVNRSDGKLRLIISPVLRNEDAEAIRFGTNESEVFAFAERSLSEMIMTSELIEKHTLECLSWLIRQRRVEIKVALMRDGMFHPKVWLFHSCDDIVAVHGSSNWTGAGIGKNVEQVAVSKSWNQGNESVVTQILVDTFDSFWSGRDSSSIVMDMPEAVERELLHTYRTDRVPQESDLRKLYDKALESSGELQMTNQHKKDFEIPEGLEFEGGDFAHQGQAIKAWLNAGGRGVLEMATGSGKTITALVCARRLFDEERPLLIVVAAPYVPLIQQWCGEIASFGIDPVNLTEAAGATGRAKLLGQVRRQLRRNPGSAAAVVVSHDTLCDTAFQNELEQMDCKTLLIADEVHNLGRAGFISRPPDFFDFRLGLSATPERQYDQKGTDELFSFFGDVVFEFKLEDAIGKCLVEYDYFVHPVDLTDDELERWYDITERIRANSWRLEDGLPDDYLNKLYRDRRVILENAENKLQILSECLDAEDLRALRYTLIYTSDKDPSQMLAVNSMLKERGLLFHPLTYEETADRQKTAEILSSFQRGELRVLTAKRVLDEGVNIPQVQKAFILASTTVERQWVQRRGRLLRQCDDIGKTHSEIHDFVVMPPETDDDAVRMNRSLARSELLRVQEFAALARNAGSHGGPLEVLASLVKVAYY